MDWKSASRKWPAAKSRQELQPTIYLHAIRAQGDGNARFRYDVVTKAKAPAVEFLETNRDPDACVRLAEAVKIVEKMTRAELFLPNDQSFACADCPHGLACQAWHRNRPAVEAVPRRAADWA